MSTALTCAVAGHRLAVAAADGGMPPWDLPDDVVRHLDRCRRCREDAEGMALATFALRRLGSDVEAVEPAADTWLAVRSRALRPRRPSWEHRASLAGLLLSSALVAVLAVRVEFRPPASIAALVAPNDIRPVAQRIVNRIYDPPARAAEPRAPAITVAPHPVVTGLVTPTIPLRSTPRALDLVLGDQPRHAVITNDADDSRAPGIEPL